MLKPTIPSVPDLHAPLIRHARVERVVSLSGGYSQQRGARRAFELAVLHSVSPLNQAGDPEMSAPAAMNWSVQTGSSSKNGFHASFHWPSSRILSQAGVESGGPGRWSRLAQQWLRADPTLTLIRYCA